MKNKLENKTAQPLESTFESPTAIPRILEEEKCALCEIRRK
ncbi:hypothetical protein [Helicobacter canis]|nr:hypothetical protein [Helicobacter canis]